MDSLSPCRLPDLFATAKTISHNECLGGLLTYRREQNPLSDRLRYLELVFFKSKSAGHPAAAGILLGHVRAHFCQQRSLVGHFHQRLMVAMAVNEDLARELIRHVARSVVLQELAE